MMADREQQQKETEELKQKLREVEEELKKQTTAAVPTPTVEMGWVGLSLCGGVVDLTGGDRIPLDSPRWCSCY